MTNRAASLQLKDLRTWIQRQITWIASGKGGAADTDLFVFQQAAKLVEEVGELHAELLGRSKLQRAAKLHAWTPDSLASEIADVVICTLILAEITGVDVEDALTKKMDVVDARAAASSHSPTSIVPLASE